MEQNNNSKRNIILLLGIMALSIGLLSNYLIANPEYILINTVTSDNSGGVDNSIGLNIIVEHYRNSELLSKQEKENDIFLRNFGIYLCGTFKGSDATVMYMNEDVAGLQKSFSWIDYSYTSQSQMMIGTGTTAPTLLDWSLETEVYYDEIMQVGYTVSGTQMNITYACSFGIDAPHTIGEAGFTYTLDTGATNYPFLMARDLLPTPIAVIAGDIVTVKYVMMFN